jgi:hypothetical protein
MATKKAAKKSSVTNKAARGTAGKTAAKKASGGSGATKKTATKSTAAKKTTKSPAKSASTSSAKKATKKRVGSARELIAPNGDKRLIRRDEQGRIKESDDLGRSLAQDVRKKSKAVVKSGQGDRGDQKKPARKATKKSK